jgi:hypothetical protein
MVQHYQKVLSYSPHVDFASVRPALGLRWWMYRYHSVAFMEVLDPQSY